MAFPDDPIPRVNFPPDWPRPVRREPVTCSHCGDEMLPDHSGLCARCEDHKMDAEDADRYPYGVDDHE